MKLALIIIAVLVVAGVAFKIYSRIADKREQARWDKLTPEEQRKEQEAAYGRHAYGSGI